MIHNAWVPTNVMPILTNYVLISALVSWSLAQIVKIPLEFIRTHRWNWALLFSAGGMPSSHSALAAATAHAIGLRDGFDSSLFAFAVAFAMIVIYDATGIRRMNHALHFLAGCAFVAGLGIAHVRQRAADCRRFTVGMPRGVIGPATPFRGGVPSGRGGVRIILVLVDGGEEHDLIPFIRE